MHSGETPAEATNNESPALPEAPPPEEKLDPCIALLEKFMEQAKQGKIKQLVIGYLLVDNDASVRMTPMPAAVMGHLSRLIERRVNAEYDRFTRMVETARSPGTQPARSSSTPSTEPPAEPQPHLPRKVRQMLKKAQKRKEKKP